MKFKTLVNICCLFTFIVVSSSVGAFPSLREVQRLDFDKLLSDTGSCQINFDTGEVTAVSLTKLCLGAKSASPGRFEIFGPVNSDYRITIKTRNPQNNDGITFVPSGEVDTDNIDILISANNQVTVNSGATGRIIIKLGGLLTLAQAYPSSQNFTIEDVVLIDWEIVP